MEEENICKFIPVRINHFNIDTKNFVLERSVTSGAAFKIIAAYIVYLVTDGKGILHTTQGSTELARGTIFFTFPSMPFRIENIDQLQYMYITALGLRVGELVERAGVSKQVPVIPGFEQAIPFWKDALDQSNTCNLDMISESVLLYTFSMLCKSEKEAQIGPLVPQIKKYIDEHYQEANLSLNKISQYFQYNAKYLSSVFKKDIGIGVCEYTNSLRIQHACELIKNGICSIKELTYLTGFSDPAYFSRVFKQKQSISPKGFIQGQVK